MEDNGDMLYVSFDKVLYALYESAEQKYYEEMLEIEDWKNPNTLHVDYSYDQHLIAVNELIQHSSLPLALTKDTKPYHTGLLPFCIGTHYLPFTQRTQKSRLLLKINKNKRLHNDVP